MSSPSDIFIVPKDYVFRSLGWKQSAVVVDGKTIYLSFNTVKIPKSDKDNGKRQ